MSGCLVVAAAAVVRAWTWLYTLPLDTAARHERRREIESDLWEFLSDRSRPGRAASRAVHVLLRAALGVPDDLLWTCEQWPDRPCQPRFSTAVRFLVPAILASGLVVSATGPALDAARVLTVNVASSGWAPVADNGHEAALAAVFAFTLTNAGDRPTGALEVNAVFYRSRSRQPGFGTAFSSAVGWRGLAPGATSRPLVLRGNVSDRFGVPLPRAGAGSPLDEARVRLFVKHEGRWTLLGDYPIDHRLIQP